ncbi:ABC transporter substrate-binding protein [Oceanibacterium hippocampi]|uniref:Leucine-, isoleucine-, valine-, threonine-, and alanine-binding protein n=1 Tax=Oceanibacterium hippocampi TaxID=745714 RepID=A0A1Y5SG06_9PROT|nr:ABC transporter substrate-binding protein [Oceanibacterium hippocampi]SLN38721.1 Leucine-, isoleucine-, valine-, threonine-, and alanine-binding protein precursor [Oceanibacterium hippocampi]
MVTRRRVLWATAAATMLASLVPGSAALAADTIRIGEINSYSGLPAFTLPYRNGWELAVEEINAAGGVLGKQLEVISRDDAGKPANAVKIAEELIANENVALLSGTFFSHIGLAVSDLAKQRKVLFVAAEPLTDAIVWEKGHKYTFRLRPSTYMQAAMLADEAAKLPAKRWATIAPNYKYGQDAVTAFKELLLAKRPDVEFVDEQWPALFKIDAGATAQALLAAKPEAIYNVTFGSDLAKFAREGKLRGLFENVSVVSLLTGEPEYLDPLGADAPEGWIVTGYPSTEINTPEHTAFRDAYKARYDALPMLGSIVGYNTMKAVAAIITAAGSTDTDAMIKAAEGLTVQSPTGPFTFRAIDHQATMGAYVGKTAVKNGMGTMVDWTYADGADYLPSDEEVRKMRPAD